MEEDSLLWGLVPSSQPHVLFGESLTEWEVWWVSRGASL